MLKIAVIGAQTLIGRELVRALGPHASVLPLAMGPLNKSEEEGDLVIFAPEPSLLEGLDVVILVDALQNPQLLQHFVGRVLDLRNDADPKEAGDPWPLVGSWPVGGPLRYRGRPALEQVLALLPALVDGVGEVSGTHLRAVAHLGDRGLEGLQEQTASVLQGEEPDLEKLGYRQAFEAIPQIPRGNLVEVRLPVFHGDLLLLHLRAAEDQRLAQRSALPGVRWTPQPPSSRDVAVNADLLAYLHLSADGKQGMLTLGFDPILWGILWPTLRLLGLLET